MKREHVLLYSGALVCALVTMQLFFRYQYVEYRDDITRIDRLTGSSCRMPCTPPPPSTATPMPTPTFAKDGASFPLTDLPRNFDADEPLNINKAVIGVLG